MLITELARATGLSADTIRFYEKMGIVTPPVRRANGYRDYPESTVACLQLCRRARELGFTLEEIRELGQLLDARELRRATVVERLRGKQREIDERIASLRRLRKDIARAIDDPALFATPPEPSARPRRAPERRPR